MLYAGSTLLMLVLATTYLHWALVRDAARDDDAFLAEKTQECLRAIETGDSALLAHEIERGGAASQFIRYFVRVLDEQGNVVLETPGMTETVPANVFPAAVDTSRIPSGRRVWRAKGGTAYGLVTARARPGGKSTARVLQVALDVSPDETLIADYRWKLLLVVVLGVCFSCAAGILVARKGLRPLKEITEVTEHVTASHLHDRVVAKGWPEELDALARSFDRMLDRLEDSFRRLSQFSDDLAHELRTPVNNLRGEAGVALSKVRSAEEYRGTLESSLEEYTRLTRLIDNMLFLARAEGPEGCISQKVFEASAAVRVVCEYYEALAEDRQVTIRCEGQGFVEADPVLFRQAVSNLLANALNYSPAGGSVLIRINQREERLNVRVSDNGCGIAPEHLPRIFDRLYRVDPARSEKWNGAGLGLAIVKSIMRLHGGGVEVHSEVGKGTEFTLSFALARPGKL